MQICCCNTVRLRNQLQIETLNVAAERVTYSELYTRLIEGFGTTEPFIRICYDLVAQIYICPIRV